MSTRREFLHLGAAGFAMAAGGLSLSSLAFADPDPAPPGVLAGAPKVDKDPEIFSFELGSWDAHVIHDGPFYMPGVQPFFVPTAPAAEVKRLLQENYLPTDRSALSVNILVLKTPHGIILVDTGTGMGATPTTGRLQRGLEILGVKPSQVAAVILTHAHFDHIGGTLNPDGKPAFPNATVYISEKEWNFWKQPKPDLSTTTLPPAMKPMAIQAAHRAFDGLGTHLKPTAPKLILPGFELLPTPGHTPGHVAVSIRNGKDQLLHIGDAVHLAALQLPHPEWGMAADTSPRDSAATRRKLFSLAATDRLQVMTGHFAFPGIGHVKRDGKGYAWVPRPWIT